MLDWLIAPIASTASSIAGFLGQQDTNAQNRELAAQNTAFQERMSNSAYQRQVKDLEAAGLNPMLAYVKGGGASTPTGTVAQMQNATMAGIQSAESASRAYLAQKQAPKVEAETKKVGAETENVGADTILKRANTLYALAQKEVAGATADEKRSNINLLESQARKIGEEVKNIPLEGKRLIQAARQLDAAAELAGYQKLTEKERAGQMRALITKTLIEGKLLNFDLESIKSTDNLGKDFGQYKPIIDTMISIIRSLKR
jgi:hypothetical protein